MHRVRMGDGVGVGNGGVRVHPLERPRGPSPFEFMASEVSSEKPKDLLVAQVAQRIRDARDTGGRVLVVCGPAVIHTGAGPYLARLVREGVVDVLFAGNGFAAHDIEANVLGTSLGVNLTEGRATEHGHSNHLRVINEVRRHGSIAAAVDAGFVRGGVMYECVRRGVPFVLGGSVRDDGPLRPRDDAVDDRGGELTSVVDPVGARFVDDALVRAAGVRRPADREVVPLAVEVSPRCLGGLAEPRPVLARVMARLGVEVPGQQPHGKRQVKGSVRNN